MSVEQKQQLGQVITWVLRILTGVGAFFLIQTYSLMKENNAMLQQHLVQYAKDMTRIEVKVGIHEDELKRYRNEREQKSRYWDQYRNEQPSTP